MIIKYDLLESSFVTIKRSVTERERGEEREKERERQERREREEKREREKELEIEMHNTFSHVDEQQPSSIAETCR